MDSKRAIKLRAWWWSRQGLDGSLWSTSIERVLASTGWMRSVGGCGPYLGLHARCGASRAAVDAAIANLQIHELPSARGCTYVLPACDFALGLAAGRAFAAADMAAARKLGVTDAEIDRLGDKVLEALVSGPLDPDAIKAAVGPAVRNLGPEGRKKGIITTLPLALGRLQAEGDIRRIPTNGRLDQQRYRYAPWRPNPLGKSPWNAADIHKELARRFFEWTGAARLAEFQAFAGIGVKAAKEAAAALGLPPLDDDGPELTTKALSEEWKSFAAPREPQYALLSSLDGLILLRRNLRSLLAEEDLERKMAEDDGCSTGGTLTDMPNNAIVDRGRVVGIWDYDQEAAAVVWASYVKPNAALKTAVADMETFVREQLGDARCFSLDSPKSRQPRLQGIRAIAKGTS